MALFNYLFQSCLASALEDSPNVLEKVRSIVGCSSNIVHVLSTLVTFDNWIQVLTQEARKSRHRSAETLCKSFVGESFAIKTDCELFHSPLNRHLQTVIDLGAIELAE